MVAPFHLKHIDFGIIFVKCLTGYLIGGIHEIQQADTEGGLLTFTFD